MCHKDVRNINLVELDGRKSFPILFTRAGSTNHGLSQIPMTGWPPVFQRKQSWGMATSGVHVVSVAAFVELSGWNHMDSKA